jgi:hypothetical protein
MKGRAILISALVLGLMLALAAGLTQAQESGSPGEVGVQASPVGTAFTYQGRLTDGGTLANGSYDFRFQLYDAASVGNQLGSIIQEDVAVTDGLFTVALDFGAGAFNGEARWLEVGVRPGSSAGAYTALSPRQSLAPAPYALALPGLWTEQNATSPNLIGGHSANSVAGGVMGATIGGGGRSDAPNQAAANYATVGGGLSSVASGPYATVGGGGYGNASGWAATIGGGDANLASGQWSTVPGGLRNTAQGNYSFAAGRRAKANHQGAFVWADSTDADFASTAEDQFAVQANGGVVFSTGGASFQINGGDVWTSANDGSGSGLDADLLDGQNSSYYLDWNNLTNVPAGFADGVDDTGAGGSGWSLTGNAGTNPTTNFLGTTDSQALELRVNNARALRLEPNADSPNVVGGYSGNSVTGGVVGAVIGGGGGPTDVWGGPYPNQVTDDYGTVGGGEGNQAGDDAGGTDNAPYCTVGGGLGNIASGAASNNGGAATVGGGVENTASGGLATIAGGLLNVASGDVATIGGGESNVVTATLATIGGGGGNLANNDLATISGGSDNTVSGEYATVGGGGYNTASGLAATIAGGGGYDLGFNEAITNTASGDWSTISGGRKNTASGWAAAVGGGSNNTASGDGAVVGGGGGNIASAWGSTACGGDFNIASGVYATVGGGYRDTASGLHATVPGGTLNVAQGEYSFAAGRRAKANHDGAFVWADSTDADFESTAADQFAVRANGGALVTGASGEPMLTVTNLGGNDGLRVNKSGDDGLQIGDGTNFPNYGVYIPSDGVSFIALYVQTAEANGEWALSTLDKISAANVTFSSLTLVAVADGPDSLTPGDLVAAAGLADPLPDTLSPLPRVRLADAKTWPGVVGVVEGRLTLQPLPGKADEDGHAPLELHSVPGPAKAGDYVALTVLGVAHVKADATAGAIVAGQRLTAADRSGHARALRTRMLEGMVVTEGAPVIGIALASLDEDTGTIPVFVTLR